MSSSIRVRFAPSPTGPLHMGGVRTALYNYLFAKKHGGTFILRIEDTDQTRFVEGAEEYIREALDWCGITPDEGVKTGGNHGPYRQSERSALYQREIQCLLDSGAAYKAFDSSQAMAAKRSKAEANGEVWQYDATTRMDMRNSLSLSSEEVAQLEADGHPYTVRFKMPDEASEVLVQDEIRGEIRISTHVLDDKVLMKTDGLPTYHLANVVDDHHMKISHVIRGEEWLPSAPLHVMLYNAFGWDPPKFAHLPLILKPTGNGKLSKRDGDKGGFPIFPLEWNDPTTGNTSMGYREQGFLPAAFLNMLLLLGWSGGDDVELYTLEEAIEAFDLQRVVKAGARFNPDKTRWFNEQYLRQVDSSQWIAPLKAVAEGKMEGWSDKQCQAVLNMFLERVQFLHEITATDYLFAAPEAYDEKLVRKKWKAETSGYLNDLAAVLRSIDSFDAATVEREFKAFLEARELGFGAVLLPFRLVLTGTGGGPSMFDFAAFLGKGETLARLEKGVAALS
ncbi:MAG: glutamate--tRNA ligase [Flavobacteriales bacterium]|nr:glutamate--tRNA ligase [Flavobacteriales bacterium]